MQLPITSLLLYEVPCALMQVISLYNNSREILEINILLITGKQTQKYVGLPLKQEENHMELLLFRNCLYFSSKPLLTSVGLRPGVFSQANA